MLFAFENAEMHGVRDKFIKPRALPLHDSSYKHPDEPNQNEKDHKDYESRDHETAIAFVIDDI